MYIVSYIAKLTFTPNNVIYLCVLLYCFSEYIAQAYTTLKGALSKVCVMCWHSNTVQNRLISHISRPDCPWIKENGLDKTLLITYYYISTYGGITM